MNGRFDYAGQHPTQMHHGHGYDHKDRCWATDGERGYQCHATPVSDLGLCADHLHELRGTR